MQHLLLFLSLIALFFGSHGIAEESASFTPSIHPQPFGMTHEGQPITLYTLNNVHGMSVSIMNYGATIVNLCVPDRTGKIEDVALGYDTLAPYFTNPTYFGVTPGRYANRIAKGAFALNGTIYHLSQNDHGNLLHGGKRGFDKYVWKEEAVDSDEPAVRFSRLSPDGEEGFPGNLYVSVTYSLTNDNALHILYEATTDQPTVVNLTNHTYFNLAGQGQSTILHHVAQINASRFTPVDKLLIPTGELKAVQGTAWDFLKPHAIGDNLKATGGKPQGYDHNFVLNKGLFSEWSTAAIVYDPNSGRRLTVKTDQPGIQFYTSNFLDGSLTGKGGVRYPQYSGFCLETQHFPDSPNQPSFPSTVLSPGATYRTETVFQFSILP